MGLGGLATKPAAAARAEAATLQLQVRKGIDPLAVREVAETTARLEAARVEAVATTFGDVAAEYIAAHRAGWRNEKHALQWKNTLATYAASLTDLPVQDVDAAAILDVLRPIWTRRGRVPASGVSLQPGGQTRRA